MFEMIWIGTILVLGAIIFYLKRQNIKLKIEIEEKKREIIRLNRDIRIIG